MEGFFLSRGVVVQNPRHQAGDTVNHNHGGKFPACEDIISHRKIIRGNQLQGTLVDSFVMPAEKDQILLLCQLLRYGLVKYPALGRHIDKPGLPADTPAQSLVSLAHRPRLHNHACAAAVRGIVHMPVLIL